MDIQAYIAAYVLLTDILICIIISCIFSFKVLMFILISFPIQKTVD